MMKEIKWSDFTRRTKTEALLLLDEPTIITSDGEPIVVVMSLENYHALVPVNSNPPRQARMVRVEGVLYREVI